MCVGFGMALLTSSSTSLSAINLSPIPVCSPASSIHQSTENLPRLFTHSLPDRCIHWSGSIHSSLVSRLFLVVYGLPPISLQYAWTFTRLPAWQLSSPLPQTGLFPRHPLTSPLVALDMSAAVYGCCSHQKWLARTFRGYYSREEK